MSEKPIHIPVLLSETIESLDIKPDGIYVDCTTGFAGHSSEIAKRLTTGRLIGFDRDPDAVKAAEEKLKDYPHTLINRKFSTFDESLDEIGVGKVDGVLMDLGVSSYQLDTAERGFSYHNDAPLDMRMSGEGLSAKDVVNGYDYQSLARIIFEYGEEKFSRSIASKIVKYREQKPIETTMELAEIIKSAVPQKARREKNPCKKTFQAIRIEVNKELEHLNIALDKAFDCLNVGGRLCIITFHSLEDRLVKQRFQSFCKGCICPPDFPQCICGRTPRGKLVNRKPIEAGEKELADNNRSRSAKLRVIEKIKD
ncbi:16S rRNA (cytosine(1402)-N(4))-methyltransferase RsmH [uncultured Ruminococcus sp.]|uniref:16S rRNA (cytosine(1402)-N(4))-methyltransferase RsmH n=1 Tax=uncultured Ruminococcus sp. TaxID=165186 RepID=UPI0025F9EF51|nr:16S rRNA (cytosine(1402)-N(4))-methyltransferase RsmH [uncultured Ruminococcus sp.]